MIAERVRSFRRASAVELPVQQRERDVVRDPDDAAAASNGPGLFVCGPPTISSSMRRAVDHRDWAISTVTRAIENPRSTDERFEILPGSPMMSATSRAPSRIGSSKRGPSRRLARQQERQEHRGEDRAGHVPARFPDDRIWPPRLDPRIARAIVWGPGHARLRLPYPWRSAIPHAPDHEAPGSSRITSTPDANAFGGHVIGSIATACRRREAGSRVSPV